MNCMNHQKTLLALALIASSGAEAALFNRGGGMIYDSTQNITWTADANLFQTQAASNPGLVYDIITANDGFIYDTPSFFNNGTHQLTYSDFNTSSGQMNWWGSQAWIGYLNTTKYDGHNEWSLPTTIPAYYGYQTSSQMGWLFYNDLGGTAGSSIVSNHANNANYNLFSNIQNYLYWSSENAIYPEYAWNFHTIDGYQNTAFKGDQSLYAWAVRTGDVAAIPIPGAAWLFGSGLLGLMGFNRRVK